jgi:hypothetical protein
MKSSLLNLPRRCIDQVRVCSAFDSQGEFEAEVDAVCTGALGVCWVPGPVKLQSLPLRAPGSPHQLC